MRQMSRLKFTAPVSLSLLLSSLCIPALHAAPSSCRLSTLRQARTPPGKVVWADLVTPDIAAAERFYGALLGWTFQTIHTGASDYAVAMIDGRRSAFGAEIHTERRTAAIRLADFHCGRRRRCGEAGRRCPWGQGAGGCQELSGARTPGRFRRSGRSGVCHPGVEQRRYTGFSRGARGMDLELAAVPRSRGRGGLLPAAVFIRCLRPRQR